MKELTLQMEKMRVENEKLVAQMDNVKLQLKMLFSARYYPSKGHEEEIQRVAKDVAKKVVRKELRKLQENDESD